MQKPSLKVRRSKLYLRACFWFLTLITGAGNILRAFTAEDLPADPEQIFLTSWGEWWPKDVYASSLDRELQAKWCLSKEDIERAEGLGK